MSRSIEELKEIFKKEQEYMIENHLEVVATVANSIMAKDDINGKIAYENLQAICKERLDQYNLDADELLVFKANQQAWAIEFIPTVIEKLKENDNGKAN